MNVEFVARYLARVFVREERSLPTSMRLAADLTEQAGLSSWTANTIQDIDAATGQVSPGHAWRSPDGVWLVKVTSESLDVQVSQGIDLETGEPIAVPAFGEFLKTAREHLVHGLNLMGTRPHRIAVVQTLVLASRENMFPSHQEVLRSLLKLPQMETEPFEWNWRSAWRVDREFAGTTEITNTIASLRMVEIQTPQVNGDRLIAELDINTDPRKENPRFSSATVTGFLTASEQWHADLARTLEEHTGIS